jgi:aspartyl-tRNA(Asn)/glutamyl-tRNA(Gln) amidotransferase subunit C
MSVTPQDVRHVAALARLGLEPERIPALVAELNGILAHMDVLAKVDTRNVIPAVGVGAGGTPLREDAGPPLPLARPRDAFAPATRDGFFLVPRLATHAAHGASADAGDDADEEAGA